MGRKKSQYFLTCVANRYRTHDQQWSEVGHINPSPINGTECFCDNTNLSLFPQHSLLKDQIEITPRGKDKGVNVSERLNNKEEFHKKLVDVV